MKWLKHNRIDDGNNYWQSVADGLAALLMMVLMLVTVMIVLISQIREGDGSGDEVLPEAMTNEMESDRFDIERDDGWGISDPSHAEGHASGGGGQGEFQESEKPQTGKYNGKAAVMVRVVDAETERLIRESGITFELYSERDTLEVLNTYYPKKIEYRNYKTTEDGTFYLPEKINLGEYYLSEITEPRGYDAADRVSIDIVNTFDWNKPFVADVLLYPSKNKICIQVCDNDTGRGIPGVEFDLFADGDVMTMDGTRRYTDGQLVGHITCDDNGYGESDELYLGAYQIRRSNIPKFYAADVDNIETQTEKRKNGTDSDPISVSYQKTMVVLSVVDELYEDIPIAQASFTLSGAGVASKRFVSDSNGKISFTDLEKDTVYTVVQENSANGYHLSDEPVSFYVSPEGFVNDEAVASLQISNRKLRLAVNIHDALLPGLTVVRSAALTDSNGNVVESWDVNGTAHVCEGLEPGIYRVMLNNKAVKEVVVEETSQIQNVGVSIWTITSVAVLVALVGLLIVGLYFVIKFSRKKKTKGG